MTVVFPWIFFTGKSVLCSSILLWELSTRSFFGFEWAAFKNINPFSSKINWKWFAFSLKLYLTRKKRTKQIKIEFALDSRNTPLYEVKLLSNIIPDLIWINICLYLPSNLQASEVCCQRPNHFKSEKDHTMRTGCTVKAKRVLNTCTNMWKSIVQLLFGIFTQNILALHLWHWA